MKPGQRRVEPGENGPVSRHWIMTHDERRDLFLFYAAGQLEPAEQEKVRALIASGCAQSAGALVEAEVTLNTLAFSLDPIEPPTEARERLMQRVLGSQGATASTSVPRSPSVLASTSVPASASFPLLTSDRPGVRPRVSWVWPMLGGLAAGVALLLWMSAEQNNRWRYKLTVVQGELANAREQMNQARERLSATDQKFSTLARESETLQRQTETRQREGETLQRQAETRQRESETLQREMETLKREAATARALLDTQNLTLVSLPPKEPGQAHGRILFDVANRTWHVRVFDLKPLPPGKTYELWFITPDQKKIPAGTFDVDPDGNGSIMVSVPDNVQVALTAITDEPVGGSPQPTGTVQLAGQISMR